MKKISSKSGSSVRTLTDIETDEGILNVHFWDSADDYYVESEDDFYENHINNGMGGIS